MDKEEQRKKINHNHNHHDSYKKSRRALWWAIGLTASIMVVEFGGGWWANSLALMSDAGHMLTDLMALLLSLFALQLTMRPPSATKTFGLYRMEILAALINGAALILISSYIFYEAYQRWQNPPVVESSLMLLIALLGLLANGLAGLILMRQTHGNLNLRGAYLHILGDALSSVGVILAGVIIHFTDWYTIDPLISMAICLVILRGAFLLVKDAVNILLEAVPKDINLSNVQAALLAIPGVKSLHHLHVWTISSGRHALSAHILVGDMQTRSTDQILKEINQTLQERFQIAHSTIQFECEDCQEGLTCHFDREN
ncbi:MAG: cation diffusion facilitator family transporter [Thermodesulfobacteriota bacterium]